MIADAKRVLTIKSVDLCSCGHPFTWRGFTSSECSTDVTCRNYVARRTEPVVNLDDATADYLASVHGYGFFPFVLPMAAQTPAMLGVLQSVHARWPLWGTFHPLDTGVANVGACVACMHSNPALGNRYHVFGKIKSVDRGAAMVQIDTAWRNDLGNPLLPGSDIWVNP